MKDQKNNVTVEEKQAFEADFETLDQEELTKISGGAIRVEARPKGGKKK
jgi:bacteriocin-like protein